MEASRNRIVRVTLIAAALFGVPLIALAEDVAGASDPAFASALAQWLADEERPALAALAGLAQEDNRAAQVLLSMIDKTPSLQGPWLSGLDRAERIALLRTPGGMSGVSWMRSAAVDVPLARLWVRLWSTESTPELVLDLSRAGEPRAARVAVMMVEARKWGLVAPLTGDPDFPRAMWFQFWRSHEAARVQAAALPAGDPQREIARIDDGLMARESWIVSSDLAEPIDGFCTALCPETFDTCSEAVLQGLGGYNALISGYQTLLSTGSPVEALVSTPEFAASPKGRADLLRRMLLNYPDGEKPFFIKAVANDDPCVAAALEAESHRAE